jgi:hypothetical protein
MIKSDRLKKLETELSDLEQWMKLGLVPKKELKRHSEEIENLKLKITEEKDRLQFLKESGEAEEYSAPRRGPTKAAYPEMPSISDIDIAEETTEGSLDVETESMEYETTEEESTTTTEEVVDDEAEEEVEEEDPFSDKNRWRRGGILDPDANEW